MAQLSPDPLDSTSISDSDDNGILTPTTSSVTFTTTLEQDHESRDWVPSHGSTVITRSIACGNAITLLDGQVVLDALGARGSMYWTCLESEGWLTFRNRVSDKFLCHRTDGKLECSADEKSKWRHFTVTPVHQRGYVMQMLDWWTLRPIVVKTKNSVQTLERTGDKISEGVVWEFIKVE